MTITATQEMLHDSTGSEEPGRVIPGTGDIWFFVFFEAFLFTAYFTAYMVQRVQASESFLASQAHLSLGNGIINTLILLISSWSMARCVQAARDGTYAAALKNAFLTIAFACGFLGSKVYEWAVKIGEGFYFTTDEFFSFYYFLTSIHFIHLLIGFIVLGIVVYQLSSPARRSQKVVETCATYWHMVDFLWINIFALLYLMR